MAKLLYEKIFSYFFKKNIINGKNIIKTLFFGIKIKT